MATFGRGIFGKSSGKVGNVVLYPDRDQQRMRSMPLEHRDAKSAAQLEHRAKIKLIQFLYRSLPSELFNSTLAHLQVVHTLYISILKTYLPHCDWNGYKVNSFHLPNPVCDMGKTTNLADYGDLIQFDYWRAADAPPSEDVNDADTLHVIVQSEVTGAVMYYPWPHVRGDGGTLDCFIPEHAWGENWKYAIHCIWIRPPTGEGGFTYSFNHTTGGAFLRKP